MFWFAALAIKFTNCAYQDGQTAWPYPRRVAWATQVAWLCLIPVTAVGVWALGLRVQQYGWTETRLWAAAVALLVSLHVFGYVLSWFDRSRWMAHIEKTNIFAACVLCLVLVGFLSPIANVQKLAVNAHLSRIAEKGAGSEPDWKYLRWQSGRFGQEALGQFASGEGGPYASTWPAQAKLVLAQRSRYDDTSNTPPKEKSKAALAQMARYPAGKNLPDTFLTYMLSSNAEYQLKKYCVEISGTAEQCSAWIGDLDGDGQDEVIVFMFRPSAQNGMAFRFEQNRWQQLGLLRERSGSFAGDLTGLEGARAVAPKISDLEIAGKRFQIVEASRAK